MMAPVATMLAIALTVDLQGVASLMKRGSRLILQTVMSWR